MHIPSLGSMSILLSAAAAVAVGGVVCFSGDLSGLPSLWKEVLGGLRSGDSKSSSLSLLSLSLPS